MIDLPDLILVAALIITLIIFWPNPPEDAGAI